MPQDGRVLALNAISEYLYIKWKHTCLMLLFIEKNFLSLQHSIIVQPWLNGQRKALHCPTNAVSCIVQPWLNEKVVVL